MTYDQHAPSLSAKWFLAAHHAVAVAIVAWLLAAGGIDDVGAWVGQSWRAGPAERRWLLVGCSLIYFLRLFPVLFAFLKRKLTWGESTAIAAWHYVIHLSLAILGGTNPRPVGWPELLGLFVYLAGSFIHTHAEYSRWRFKQCPENQGRLYTRGWFALCMHPNYLADVALFVGFAVVTGRAVAVVIPFLMLLCYIVISIPMLDRHLRRRYGEQFVAHRARTHRLIPGIY